MCRRVAGRSRELHEIPGANGWILLLQPLLIRDGLLLNEFNVQGAAMSVL
jgi:hypothetical protein